MALFEHLLEKEFGEPGHFLLGLIQLTQRGESFTSATRIAVALGLQAPLGEGDGGFSPPRGDTASPLKPKRRSTGDPNPELGVHRLDRVAFNPWP